MWVNNNKEKKEKLQKCLVEINKEQKENFIVRVVTFETVKTKIVQFKVYWHFRHEKAAKVVSDKEEKGQRKIDKFSPPTSFSWYKRIKK